MLELDKNHMQTDRASLVAELVKAGAKFKGNACTCPFHKDHNPSAGVFESDLGIWRFKCQACGAKGDYFDIKAKNEGKTLAEIFTEGNGKPETPVKTERYYKKLSDIAKDIPGTVQTWYVYKNPTKGLVDLAVFRVVDESGRKTFRQASRGKQGYVLRAPAKPWPLFQRKEIAEAKTVVVVEGEKDAKALLEYGIAATTSPCGAGKAQHADWTPLAGKSVVLWPDNDEPGHKHVKDIEKILQTLDPPPRIAVLKPAELDLAEKEDASDLIEQLKAAGYDKAQIQQELRGIIDNAKPHGIAANIAEHYESAIRGEIRAVQWPWPTLSYYSKALLPGTVTLLCGSAGASKSFMLLQALAYWHENGIKIVCFQLEEHRDFHLVRALAQKADNADLTDPDWARENPESARQAYTQHEGFLDSFGARITAGPEKQWALPQIANWIEEQAKAQCRVIAIDPITAAMQTAQPWIADNAFLQGIKQLAQKYKCSIVLVLHPSKVFSRPDMNQMAGGASYSRFAQAILWLQNHDSLVSTVKTSVGTDECRHNRTLWVLKARNAKGTGMRLAYDFSGDNLTVSEMGTISK